MIFIFLTFLVSGWKFQLYGKCLYYYVLLIVSSASTGFYSPIKERILIFRNNTSDDYLTSIPTVLYSGRPVVPMYSIDERCAACNITPEGLLYWSVKRRPKADHNGTITVEASYRDKTAKIKIVVKVLAALKELCRPTPQEVCFGGTTTYQVYQDSRGVLDLGSVALSRPPCSLSRPKYSLISPNTTEAATVLEDGRLMIRPVLLQTPLILNISCQSVLGSAWTQVNVLTLPRQLKPFPILSSRKSVTAPTHVLKGGHLLVGWAVVERNTTVTWQDDTSSTGVYTLRTSVYNISTDLHNISLILLNLTWTKDRNFTKGFRIPISLLICSKSCKKEAWTVTVGEVLPVSYPEGRLPVSASPLSRVSQPLRNVSQDIRFRDALPDKLDSPFSVTPRQGIVYLKEWGPTILHQHPHPGFLVECWKNGTVGLNWLEVRLVGSGCPPRPQDWSPKEPLCSEKVSRAECEATCGLIGASSLSKGRCSWRGADNPRTNALSTNYSTCTPDIRHCPDKWCDPLETLYPELCQQDCIKEDSLTLGNVDGDGEGIYSGPGVCTCTSSMCQCGGSHKLTLAFKAPRTTHPPPVVKGSLIQDSGGFCEGRCALSLFVMGAAGLVVAAISAVTFLLTPRGQWESCLRKKPQEPANYATRSLLPMTSLGDTSALPLHPHTNHTLEIDPKWEIPRCRLMVEECLGEGEFGRVLKATARDLNSAPGYTTVAVKTLKENAGRAELTDLMSEYQLLKEVSHPNVIRLLGACSTSGAPVYIIMEYCALGSLRAYLRRSRNIKTPTSDIGANFQPTNDIITPRDILGFAWQISKGMAYLTEIKLVHRDLAARNILLATGKVCKISDFGLTRDVYEDDAYLKKSRGRVPVKWMALECLSDHVYTSKSDVWSFGVVLWELVTLGSSPYPGIAVQNLYHLLKNGYRMQKPHNCSIQLYEIMRSCWHTDPADRPIFEHLVAKLERMLEDGSDYLDCNIRMVTNPSYFTTPTDDETNEMNIKFTMDLKEINERKYENELVTKITAYDTPKPVEYDKPKPVDYDIPKPVDYDIPKPVDYDTPKPPGYVLMSDLLAKESGEER